MTIKKTDLCRQYTQWRAAIGARPDRKARSTLENAPVLSARNARSMRTASAGKLTRAVAVHTDKTHIFAFEETTVWRRDTDGDLSEQIGCHFEILIKT